ncbi:hypothetical protein DJ60_924 [Yersinia enterocolitica]|uniref:hypothetical protein n=1 Tax=Yersinia enterocolitica TaxID=630 RepID=UPI000502E751|nr:hypothetical protein [Yersinia enterocolitica]KGA78083.1 hypothetical protein DJ60_924 [Yersinia enterocolitica]HDL7641149.1 membrane domain protein [Yersinia enterocolitica]HDL7757266.1 membrane domain protein [Yersinia enterocolitica]HDL7774055.1 membrane domain protein [Yersinia enterocolitica]HDL7782239.1 membrane domain protein [Yersinia enterocolitica]
MATYSRTNTIAGISLAEEGLHTLCSKFVERYHKLVLSSDKNKENQSIQPYFYFSIWFDSKVYKSYSVEGLIKYFKQAKSIDKIIFVIETIESATSGRKDGSWMELCLDEINVANCYLAVASNDIDWVDSSWISIQDVLSKCKNNYKWLRTSWTVFGVQLSGVLLGFLLSLWSASKIAPQLSILEADGRFAFGFICSFIIFSNIWTFTGPLIIKLLNFLFPNVKFLLNGRIHFHWGIQAIIGGVAGAMVLYFFGYIIVTAVEVLKSIFTKS